MMSNKPQFVGERASFSQAFVEVSRGVKKFKQNQYAEHGLHPIIDQGKETVAGYSDEESGLLTDVPAIVFGDHTRCVKYVEEPFFAGADGVKILKPKLCGTTRFWWHALKATPIENLGYSRHFKLLKAATFKVFDETRQVEIAANLDGILEQITRAEKQLAILDSLVKSRFVEMFGAYEPCHSIDDVCVVLSGFAFKSTRYVDDGIRIMRIANVQKGYIEDKTPCYYPAVDQNAAVNYALREDDLLVSLTGNVGRVGLMTKELLPAALNQRVACLRPKNSNRLDIRYLFALLNLDKFENAAIEASSGSAQKNLSIKWLKSHRIAIPPSELQSAFSAFCKQVDKSRFAYIWNRTKSVGQTLSGPSLTLVIQHVEPQIRSKYWADASTPPFWLSVGAVLVQKTPRVCVLILTGQMGAICARHLSGVMRGTDGGLLICCELKRKHVRFSGEGRDAMPAPPLVRPAPSPNIRLRARPKTQLSTTYILFEAVVHQI